MPVMYKQRYQIRGRTQTKGLQRFLSDSMVNSLTKQIMKLQSLSSRILVDETEIHYYYYILFTKMPLFKEGNYTVTNSSLKIRLEEEVYNSFSLTIFINDLAFTGLHLFPQCPNCLCELLQFLQIYFKIFFFSLSFTKYGQEMTE